MYVISGCPRSGTSLMMDLMRVAYGEDRIIGEKFPQENRFKNKDLQGENESDEQFEMRQYIMSKKPEDPEVKKALDHSKDMNPNGFWEMLYTCQGVHYRFGDTGRLENLKKEEKKSFCKIVSQGLAQSDPQYIDKIIYMIRHPRAVAKSQEKLIRSGPISEKIEIDGEEMKIHTPEMYINVTGAASRWFLKYPDVPVLFVDYDDLLEKPKRTLVSIQMFLGDRGNIKKATKQINIKLKRSLPEDIDHDLWEDAEFIFDKFVEKKYQEIIDYLQRPDIETNISKVSFVCQRSEVPVNLNICKACRGEDKNYIKNQIKQSVNKESDWRKEPCIFECLYNRDYKLLSIEESIKHNFWKDGIEPQDIEEVEEIEEIEETVEDKIEDAGEVEEVILGPEFRGTIITHLEIFIEEYPEIDNKDWNDFAKEKPCRACRQRVFRALRDDKEKLNTVISKIKGKPISLVFPGPLDEPIVKEFDGIVEIEVYLKEMKKKRISYQNVSTSPNGKGGYVLILT